MRGEALFLFYFKGFNTKHRPLPLKNIPIPYFFKEHRASIGLSNILKGCEF